MARKRESGKKPVRTRNIIRSDCTTCKRSFAVIAADTRPDDQKQPGRAVYRTRRARKLNTTARNGGATGEGVFPTDSKSTLSEHVDFWLEHCVLDVLRGKIVEPMPLG